MIVDPLARSSERRGFVIVDPLARSSERRGFVSAEAPRAMLHGQLGPATRIILGLRGNPRSGSGRKHHCACGDESLLLESTVTPSFFITI